MLSQRQRIDESQQFDLIELSEQPALNALKKIWKFHSKTDSVVCLHLIMAAYADSIDEVITGKFNQTSIIGCDETKGTVTLAQRLKTGRYLSWALPDSSTAQLDMTLMCNRMAMSLETPANFGLMFGCLGCGPYFYDGIDRDLEIVKHIFPNMAVLEFYGNSEISCIDSQNQLLPY